MPYAVPINRKSLDLIATNNGGLKPQIEMGPKGFPGTYFVLEDDPNLPAKIISIEDFFETYEFLEPESLTDFRPIAQIQKEAYSISRDLLARMVAAHTSGLFNAIPEQDDFDHADAMIELLEKRLNG
jgi:hypothetical protein